MKLYGEWVRPNEYRSQWAVARVVDAPDGTRRRAGWWRAGLALARLCERDGEIVEEPERSRNFASTSGARMAAVEWVEHESAMAAPPSRRRGLQ